MSVGKHRLLTSRKIFWVYSRGGFFSRNRPTVADQEQVPESPDPTEMTKRKIVQGQDGHLTKQQLNLLKAKQSLTTRQGYKPPQDVRERIEQMVVSETNCRDGWYNVSLQDPKIKYKILTRLMKEFDHDIPNAVMSGMKSVQDAVTFFQTEVRGTSALEDLARLDLPKNIHIQMEPNRFHPDTDAPFGGRTAFPGRDTHVTSIKYRRKYESIKIAKEKPGYANHYYGY